MKNIIILFSMFLVLGTTGFAQQKTAGKAVISTPSVQCERCKMRIENYLLREDGVTSAKVDIKKKTTTVTWITDKTNIEYIKTAIANVGYDADDVTAEESSYERLPTCCKKPVVIEKVEVKKVEKN